MLKGICAVLVVVLFYLQYQIWHGKSGYFAREAIIHDREKIVSKLTILKTKNHLITNEIRELRRSTGLIESHARTRLGMIKEGEIFLIVPEEGS